METTENIIKKNCLSKLTKFTFCELIGFFKFSELKTYLNVSKKFRDSILFYFDLYVKNISFFHIYFSLNFSLINMTQFSIK